MDAIPSGILTLFKGLEHVDDVQALDPLETAAGCASLSPTFDGCTTRALFQKEIVSTPYVVSYWSQFVAGLDWKII